MINSLRITLQKHWRKRKYKKIQLSNSALQLISNYTNIRNPFSDISNEIPQYERRNSYNIGSKKFRKHHYSKYYYELADYLNKRETILLGKKLSENYWEKFSPARKKDYCESIKNVLGYHDEIEPSWDIKGTRVEVNKFGRGIEILDFAGRFGVAFPVYKSVLENSPIKGIILAIHGHNSGPDYVMATRKNINNERYFGDKWVQNGYLVYAPQVDPDEGIRGLYRLNFSDWGHDLSRLRDLIKYIEDNENENYPLIVIGFSHGAHLAEWISIICDRVDALITSGGTGRGSTFGRLLSNNYPNFVSPERMTLNTEGPLSYYFYFNGPNLFRLLAPKPLVISMGTHDWGEDKFNDIIEVSKYYKQNGWEKRFNLNIFYGFHEVDAEGDYLALKKLIENKALDMVIQTRLARNIKR